MKKVISIILAVVLLSAMSVTTFATDINQDSEIRTGETTITLGVEPTYSVTIPSAINLVQQADQTYAGSGTISTSLVRLPLGITVGVFMESDFEMTTSLGAKHSYTATIDGQSTAIVNNDKVAEFSTSEAAQSVKLNFTAGNPRFSGRYSDTAIFSISLLEEEISNH